MTVVVDVDSLSKTYRVYRQPWARLVEPFVGRRLHKPHHALHEVSFQMKRGEALGVVGENGAGKSTLLKILTGISMPSSGRAEVAGTIAAILELGSGFHPELSGRENIVLNAAMLGLGPDEIDARLPEIVDFSELGGFIEQPVKNYSTGMAMRLAFSIAVQVEPEVLIIDEALSVGDGYFQKKCMDRMREYVDSGRTLLFCSHAMYYVSAFCHRALWLRDGKVAALGPADEVIRDYETFLVNKAAVTDSDPAPAWSHHEAEESPSPSGARLLEAAFPEHDGTGTEPARFTHGESWCLDIAWEHNDDQVATHLGVGINRVEGTEVCAFATHHDDLPPTRGTGEHRIRLEMPALPLVKGEFTVHLYLLDEAGLHVYDHHILPGAFTVRSPEYRFGIVDLPHSWHTASERITP